MASIHVPPHPVFSVIRPVIDSADTLADWFSARLHQALSPTGAPRYVYRAETRRWTSIELDVTTLRRVDGLAR